MITGDQQAIAREMAKTIGLGVNILLSDVVPELPPDMKAPLDTGLKYGEIIEGSDGFAQVFPEHKFMIVEALKQRGWTCGMTGDGVNDAPALAAASVGIAMGAGGTDVALETADVALMADDLSKLPFAIGLSRRVRRTIIQNFVISLGVIGALVPIAALGLTPMWIAVIFHEGSTLVVVANALRLLAYEDRTR